MKNIIFFRVCTLILSVSALLAACSSTKTETAQQSVTSPQLVVLSSLPYNKDMTLNEAKQAVSYIIENESKKIPISSGGVTIINEEFDPKENVWVIYMNIEIPPKSGAISKIRKAYENPKFIEQREISFASRYCGNDKVSTSMRSYLMNGIKVKHVILTNNEFVGNIFLTKDSYCDKNMAKKLGLGD